MIAPNAIERLRAHRPRIVDEQVSFDDALAAVDALYQAAKDALDDDGVAWENLDVDDVECVEEFARNWGAAKTNLAAAVRRVEGE